MTDTPAARIGRGGGGQATVRPTLMVALVLGLFGIFGGIAAATTTWTERGELIPGSGAGAESGSAVAISDDGTVIAIGAPAVSSLAGEVNVYEWSGSAWVQRGSALTGSAAGDVFGRSVALSADGTVLAVGASLADAGGANRGQVSVYQWTGSAWVQRGTTISGTENNGQLGAAVSLSDDGDYLAIGVPYAAGRGSNNGEVQIYWWVSGSWSRFGLGVPITGSTTGEQLGESVSISGNGLRLVAGAPFGALGRGVVRAFSFGGSGWGDLGTAVIGGAVNDRFGVAVAMSSNGESFIAGAPGADTGGSDSGQVRIYGLDDGTFDWVQRGGTVGGAAAGDEFGGSVAISNDGLVVAVAAQLSDVPASSAGSVTIYTFDGTSWNGYLIEGSVSGGKLGAAIALTPDAGYLIAGANGEDSGGGDSGSTYVYASLTTTTSGGSSTSFATFTFLLPDGRECTSISPQRVQIGTMVQLPGADALCQTSDGSSVAGWVIPVPHDFTGYGSAREPFPPGLPVRVVASQRFTLVPFEQRLTIDYDANIATSDSCTPVNLAHVSDDGRVGYSWVPRADFALARTWSQAPCVPSGYELAGWNTAGDGSGQAVERGAPLPASWATDRTNNHRLYAMWRQREIIRDDAWSMLAS